jgi:hypothetical protein
MDNIFSSDSALDGVRPGQHLVQAFFGGIIASLAGALFWMFITDATGLDVGYAAILIGAMVGLTVRYTGNGPGLAFGFLGAVLTFVGSALAEILALMQSSTDIHNDFFSVVKHLHLPELISSLVTHATPVVCAVYLLGIAMGYFLSMRK